MNKKAEQAARSEAEAEQEAADALLQLPCSPGSTDASLFAPIPTPRIAVPHFEDHRHDVSRWCAGLTPEQLQQRQKIFDKLAPRVAQLTDAVEDRAAELQEHVKTCFPRGTEEQRAVKAAVLRRVQRFCKPGASSRGQRATGGAAQCRKRCNEVAVGCYSYAMHSIGMMCADGETGPALEAALPVALDLWATDILDASLCCD